MKRKKRPRLACRGQKKDGFSRHKSLSAISGNSLSAGFKPLEPPLLQYIDPYCDGDGTTNDAEQEDNNPSGSASSI